MKQEALIRESLRMFESSIIFTCLILYTVTRKNQFLAVCGFFVAQMGMGRVLKLSSKALLPKSIWMRPKGAINCSAAFGYGKTNNMGFPSGHAMGAFSMATLGTAYIIHQKEKNGEKLSIRDYSSIVALYSVAVLIALSRTTVLGSYSGGGYRVPVACHTFLQIAVGALSGIIFTHVFIRYFGKHVFEDRNEKKVLSVTL